MSDKRFSLTTKFQESANAFAQALIQPINQKLPEFFEQADAVQGIDAYLAQVSSSVTPKAASFANFFSQNPYSNPEQIKTNIQEAAERGWIDLAEKEFTATPKALAFTDTLVRMLKDGVAPREAELDMDLARLVSLLGRLVESAQAVDAFAEKPNFSFARNYEYEDKTPSLLWVRRHLVTMGAYRDDAHIAAWRAYDLPGYVWETFTFVWQDEAHTAAELAEKLSFRGYAEEDYAQALAQLAERGWLAAEDDRYTLTEEGRKQRQLAEDKTNENYQAAFAALSDAEVKEIISLLKALTEAVAVEEEAQTA